MRTIKKILPRIAFVLALLCSVGLLSDTLLIKRYDGVTPMRAYYDQPKDTVDVLILGTSHAGVNLSTQAFWDEYGISSFALWAGLQPFWNTYHFLVEALKTQTPKLVVVETFAATFEFEYSTEERQISSIEGMNLSLNKWQAIKVSAPPERWLDLLMMLPLAHAHYSELGEEDFQYYPWDDLSTEKGTFSFGYKVNPLEDAADAKAISEVKPLMAKEQLYLDKIIALCKEKQLPLLLVTAPTRERDAQQPYYNRVAQIADENGLAYLNCNLLDEETGFDATTDFRDSDSHINERGTIKITRYFAEYIQNNYDIPDHRGDPKYESWEISSRTMQNNRLTEITDRASYFEELVNSHYICRLVRGDGQYPTDEEYEKLIEEIGRLDDAQGGLMAHLAGGENSDVMFQCPGTPENKSRLFTEEEKAAAMEAQAEIPPLGEGAPDGRGVFQLTVYDPDTQKCVDVVEFWANENYALKRRSQ